MNELSKVLNAGEKVFWEGGPTFWPFFLSTTVPVFIFASLWTGFILFIYAATQAMTLFALPHFWIGLVMLILPPIYNYLVFYKTYYAITDKRVIVQSGIIGRDFKMIDFDQITNAEVTVGLSDKVFGLGKTGSINISTAGTVVYDKHGSHQAPYVLRSVTNPYDVFKFLKQVSHDVKTDIEYPNQLRPAENPGYKTEYKPPEKI